MKQKQQIVDMWESMDDGETSTERLIQMCADACNCTTEAVVAAVFTEPTTPTEGGAK